MRVRRESRLRQVRAHRVVAGGHFLGHVPDDLQRSGEETLGRIHVAVHAKHGVDQVSLGVDRPVEVTPDPLDLHVGFVGVPLLPALPRLLARRWSVSRGATRASHCRTVSWLKTNPRSRNISARWRRLRG